jgi:hypothetical protein
MTLSYIKDKNHPDYKSGVRAVTSKVFPCPVCTRDVNTMYDTDRGTIKLACCKSHTRL